MQPGVTARCSSARVGVGKRRGGAWRSFLRRELAWARARSAARSAAERRAGFPSVRGGERGRGGERSAARRGDRRVSAWAKTRRPAASSTSGGLGRLGSSVAIWLGLCVRASGGATKMAAAAVVAWREGRAPLGFRVDDAARRPSLRHVLWHVLRNALRRVLHVLVFNVLPKGGVGGGMRVLGVGSAAGRR